MKFSYRVYNHESEKLLAIADSDIIGKTFTENGVQITVSVDFYGPSKCDAKTALKLIKGATIINAIGREAVSLLVKEKLVENTSVLTIEGVPHAQIISFG